AQRLAGPQEDGNVLPAPVLDPGAGRGERLTPRAGRDALRFGVARVLAAHGVHRIDGLDGPKEVRLGVADVVRIEGRRRLHGDQREDLQDVVLNDVPNGSVVIVVARSAADVEVLRGGDLDV